MIIPLGFYSTVNPPLHSSRLLNTAQGSLLDDEVLVNTLQSSKTTSEEVSEQLETSVQTEEKIDAAREVCVHMRITVCSVFPAVCPITTGCVSVLLQYYTCVF